MKKEALVAGLGSFISNQTNDPKRTALNVAKALGTEVGGAAGGFLGLLPGPFALLTAPLGYVAGSMAIHKLLNKITRNKSTK